MSYFIFTKDSDNIVGALYRIAENQSDLNNLNINESLYKIIEDSQSNFDLVKLGIKQVSYNGSNINYFDETVSYKLKIELDLEYCLGVYKLLYLFQ